VTRRSARAFLGQVRKDVAEWVRYRTGRVALVNRDLGGLPYLVATPRGLLAAGPDGYRWLARGHYYGISFSGDAIDCFEKLAGRGRVVRLRRRGDRIVEARVVLKDLSPGCHQIDWAGGFLYVTDTYNNRVLKFDPGFRLVEGYYPLGPCERGRASDNYAHINSVLFHGGAPYLVCHNETAKTGRPSQVLRCDGAFRVAHTYDGCGASAHNIVFLPDGTGLVCDSGGARVLDLEGRTRAKVDLFARGLSADPSGIVVGGSELAEREARASVGGRLYFFTPDFAPRGTLDLPGMVQEVRRLDGEDYSLSAYWERVHSPSPDAVAAE